MSRSWPRVMSPTPGRSILITSAPNQARSWVQVGPDWTWVKSRMRTPSRALPASPHGRRLGAGIPLPALLRAPLVFFAALRGAALAVRSATTFLVDERLAALRLAAALTTPRALLAPACVVLALAVLALAVFLVFLRDAAMVCPSSNLTPADPAA